MQWLPETSCKRGHIPALFAKLPSRPSHGSSTRTFDLQLRSQSSAGRSCSLHSKLIECSWAAGAISLPLHAQNKERPALGAQLLQPRVLLWIHWKPQGSFQPLLHCFAEGSSVAGCHCQKPFLESHWGQGVTRSFDQGHICIQLPISDSFLCCQLESHSTFIEK